MIGHTVKTLWAMARYFTLGLATALLAAPQTGADSRRMLRDRILALFDQALPTDAPHHGGDTGAAVMDKQEYWEKSGAAPENHPVL